MAILKRHRKESYRCSRREECPLSTLVAYRIQDPKTWSRWSQVDQLWRERFDWPAGRIHGNQYTTLDSAKLPLVDRSVAGRIPQPAWKSPVYHMIIAHISLLWAIPPSTRDTHTHTHTFTWIYNLHGRLNFIICLMVIWSEPGCQRRWWCPSRSWGRRLRLPSSSSRRRRRRQTAWAQRRGNGPSRGGVAPWNKLWILTPRRWGAGKGGKIRSCRWQTPPRRSDHSASLD